MCVITDNIVLFHNCELKIDRANIKYGRNALSIAQARLKKRWNIKRQYSSKIDTACFDLLPVVRIF